PTTCLFNKHARRESHDNATLSLHSHDLQFARGGPAHPSIQPKLYLRLEGRASALRSSDCQSLLVVELECQQSAGDEQGGDRGIHEDVVCKQLLHQVASVRCKSQLLQHRGFCIAVVWSSRSGSEHDGCCLRNVGQLYV